MPSAALPLISSLILTFSFAGPLTAQPASPVSPVVAASPIPPGDETALTRSLNVRWELGSNYYQGKRQALNIFTFTNKGKASLPAAGWALYFNSASAPRVGKTPSGLLVQDLGGCLFRLTPSNGFMGIKPGDSLWVEFISADGVANTSDAPEGLYLVWDDRPEKGIPVGMYAKTPITNPSLFDRFPGDRIPEATPEVVYDTNRVIRDIPGFGRPDGKGDSHPLIFPTPASVSLAMDNPGYYKGGPLVLTDTLFSREAEYLGNQLKRITGHKPETINGALSGDGIQLVRSAIRLPEEGYRLEIAGGKITITASTPAGMFYGIQTLIGQFPLQGKPNAGKPEAGKPNADKPNAGSNGRWSLPPITVGDAPRFAYRSVVIDVARNFQPMTEIFRVIDLMAFCKLNVLHLHLTDDEGWRLEIPSLPELTAVGAKRGHTLDDRDFLRPCYGSGPDTNSVTGSGFYTRTQFIAMLRYANSRHIRVIPEIESPGHARAAIKSMDNRYRRFMEEGKPSEALRYLLRDTVDQSVYSTPQLYHDDVLNIALPSVYRFIGTVVDDIADMYREAGAPLETIHLGGDEVPAGVWEKSPACLALVQASPGMSGVGDLWYYYFGKADSILRGKGLYVSAWEEAGMRKTLVDGNPRILPNPDFSGGRMHVHIWNNGDGAEDLAYRMANNGYKVVLAVASNLYFDMAYNKSFDEFGYFWATFTDVDKSFGYIPYDFQRLLKVDGQGNPLPAGLGGTKEKLTDYGKSNIVGLEGCLWGETLKGPADLEYKLLPKMLGLAERAWAPDPGWANIKDTLQAQQAYAEAWSVFANTLGKTVLPFLDVYNGGYAYRIPTPGAVVRDGKVLANVQFPGMIIRYTTDGKEPDARSAVYTDPIASKGQVRLRVYNAAGRGGRVVEVDNP
jgi:hexosaminidase